MNDYNDDLDLGDVLFEVFLSFLVLCWVAAWVLIIFVYTTPPNKGYGGSPGHLSPMEVEALYEKNRR